MDLQDESIYFFHFPSSMALNPFFKKTKTNCISPLIFSLPYKYDFIFPLLVFTPSPCQLFQTSFSPLTECVLHLFSFPSLLPPSLRGGSSAESGP